MLSRQENVYLDNHKRTGKCARKFARAFTSTVLTTGILLATATYALSAPDLDNNPPGPRGGPGASPDAKPWRPWVWRKLFDNDDNPPGPRGGRGTNWENPHGPRGGPGASPDVKPWRPAVRRRIYNARQLPRPHRPMRPRRLR